MFYDRDVDFIIDIGGQDMKAMKIEDGVINSILLNEGLFFWLRKFLETFAQELISMQQFTEKTCYLKPQLT